MTTSEDGGENILRSIGYSRELHEDDDDDDDKDGGGGGGGGGGGYQFAVHFDRKEK